MDAKEKIKKMNSSIRVKCDDKSTFIKDYQTNFERKKKEAEDIEKQLKTQKEELEKERVIILLRQKEMQAQLLDQSTPQFDEKKLKEIQDELMNKWKDTQNQIDDDEQEKVIAKKEKKIKKLNRKKKQRLQQNSDDEEQKFLGSSDEESQSLKEFLSDDDPSLKDNGRRKLVKLSREVSEMEEEQEVEEDPDKKYEIFDDE